MGRRSFAIALTLACALPACGGFLPWGDDDDATRADGPPAAGAPAAPAPSGVPVGHDQDPAPATAGPTTVARCRDDAPFTSVAPFDALAAPAGRVLKDPPHLSSDELVVYFTVNDPAAPSRGVLYAADRRTRGEAFGPPVEITNLNKGSTRGGALSPDGRWLVFASNHVSGASLDLFVAERTAPPFGFSEPKMIGGVTLSGAWSETNPYLTGDTLWYSRNTSESNVFAAGWSSGSGTVTSTQTTHVATAADEGGPVATEDGLAMYFRSNASPSSPRYTIRRAARSARSEPFAPATVVKELDEAANRDAGPGWISPDNCRLYFRNDRGYMLASRTPS